MRGLRSVYNPDDVIVLAGGASVMEYDLHLIDKRGYLIAVNDAALFTQCDVAFTMDRLWLEGRQRMLKILNPPQVHYRKGTPKNFDPPQRWMAFSHSETDPTILSSTVGFLNGSNSGACALNLAFQRAQRRVFMLGFDMQRGPSGEKHWYPDYPWAADEKSGTKRGTYRDWTEEFGAIAAQFEAERLKVYNVNHRSLITAFETITYDKFLRMTL
jgi:hypothetical protein